MIVGHVSLLAGSGPPVRAMHDSIGAPAEVNWGNEAGSASPTPTAATPENPCPAR